MEANNLFHYRLGGMNLGEITIMITINSGNEFRATYLGEKITSINTNFGNEFRGSNK